MIRNIAKTRYWVLLGLLDNGSHSGGHEASQLAGN